MITDKISLKALYYLKDKRIPDLINLLQATCDILEKARVIENDKNIISFDGSRIIGVDKANPRVEIKIERRD
jgi:Holliday junction resolvase RusA-like endonuclease